MKIIKHCLGLKPLSKLLFGDGLMLFIWCALCTCDIAVQWDLRLTNIGGWYTIFKTGCTIGLAIWSLRFWGGRWIRWVYIVLFVWMAIVLSLEWFVRINFNTAVAGDVWLFVAGSSKDEVISFIRQFISAWMMLFGVIGISVVCGGIFYFLKAHYPKVNMLSVLIGVLSLMIACWLNRLPLFELSSYVSLTKPLICHAIVSESISNRKVWQNLKCVITSPRLPEEIRSKAISEKSPLGVVVIGESATRNHMSLYGYGRKTTPWADSVGTNLVFFSNYLGSAPHTQLALKDVFTDCTIDGDGMISYTLPQILESANYEMAFISAQGHWGRGASDSYLSMIVNDFPSKFYLDEVTNVWPKYDGMLLPPIKEKLQSFPSAQPCALFVHLIGSHYDFKDRTPPEHICWPKNSCENLPEDLLPYQIVNINQYDNSIRYTDMILSNVVSIVGKMNRPAFVLYFSDHGETPSSRAFRDQSDDDLWELPLFIWFSDEYCSVYPGVVRQAQLAAGRPLQGDQLTLGIAELFGVSVGNGSESFLSDKFKVRKPRYILRGKKCYRKD